jgi:outer membrane immunogenic protein
LRLPRHSFLHCDAPRYDFTLSGEATALLSRQAITDNWSWKVKYIHVDLGTVSTMYATLPVCAGTGVACVPASAGTGTISSRVTDEIIRVGLNYRFGRPVVANC